VRPEEALEAARAAAAALAAAEGPEPAAGFAIAPTDRVGDEQLMEWAAIEPDVALMRSTRRGGAPITWLKRLLLRALQQYHNELTSQQTRFNLHVAVRLAELDDRVRALENEVLRERGEDAAGRA
jgi:hypothetical protein